MTRSLTNMGAPPRQTARLHPVRSAHLRVVFALPPHMVKTDHPHPLPTGLALGSNLGDSQGHLRDARDFLLSLHEGEANAAVSGLYATEPVDCPPGSHSFLNAAVEISTSRSPQELLATLAAFETKLGRPTRRERNAPRAVDLDILYVGDLVRDSPELVLPHPRLAQRRFVLQPLADIRPELVLPGQTRTIAQLLAALPAAHDVRLMAAQW